MYRRALGCCLGVLLCLGARPIRADVLRDPPAKQVQALQEAIKEAIRSADPSIACILVSRSDAYQRYGQGPTSDNTGRLGGYNPEALDLQLRLHGLSREERDRIKKQLDLADPANVPESYGSGVVVDEKGLVLTNYHVVRDATRVFVRLPGEVGSYADIHAADPRSDLAVLRLLNRKASYQALKFGDGGKVERGQFVVALANPYAAGFRDGQPSASWGIISNVRRRAPGGYKEEERTKTLHQYGTLLQTDVRLSLGCSGGALVSLKGELLALTTSLAAVLGGDTPGGFAVPMDEGIRRIIEVLKKGEEVEYGFLGVGFDRDDDNVDGVTLGYVTPGSPAERRGLQARDTILAVNGVGVRTSDDLFLALGTLLAGAQVELDVRHGLTGQREKVFVTLAKYHVPGRKIAARSTRPYFRGLRVDYTSLLVQQQPRGLAPQRIPGGVLVSEVQPNSPAATALLKPGEVITHVNNRPVDTPAAFYQEVGAVVGPVEFTLSNTQPGQIAPKVTVN